MHPKPKEDLSKTSVLFNALTERLRLNHVFREHFLMAGLNSRLEIRLEHFLRWDLLQGFSRQEVLQCVAKVNFLRVGSVLAEGRELQTIQLQYEHSQRTVLVAGAYRQQVEKLLDKFCQNYFKHEGPGSRKTAPAVVVGSNGFWVTIEAIHDQVANNLTVFLRGMKKKMEFGPEAAKCKIENRRIRIILLSEDLFSLFVDSSAELKAQKFGRMMRGGEESDRRRVEMGPASEMGKNGVGYRVLPVARDPNYENCFSLQKCNFAFYQGYFALNNFSNTTSGRPKKEVFSKKDQGSQTDFLEEKQPDNISELSSEKYGESVHTVAETEREEWKIREECLKEQESFGILEKDQNSTKANHCYSMSENQDANNISFSSNNSEEHIETPPILKGEERSCISLENV